MEVERLRLIYETAVAALLQWQRLVKPVPDVYKPDDVTLMGYPSAAGSRRARQHPNGGVIAWDVQVR